MVRALVALVGLFWGLALIGVGFWMERNGDATGMIACVFYAAVYFWFTMTTLSSREMR